MIDRKIGSVITDSSGNAEYTYTGGARGNRNIVMKCGRNQSETFPLWDYIFEDINNSRSQSDYYISKSTGITLSNVDDYKLVESTYNNNITRLLTPNYYDGDCEYVVEVNTSTNPVNIQVINNASEMAYVPSYVTDLWRYFKIKREGNTLTAYVSTNGETWQTTSLSNSITSFSGGLRFGFSFGYLQDAPKFKFKNLKVYPI